MPKIILRKILNNFTSLFRIPTEHCNSDLIRCNNIHNKVNFCPISESDELLKSVHWNLMRTSENPSSVENKLNSAPEIIDPDVILKAKTFQFPSLLPSLELGKVIYFVLETFPCVETTRHVSAKKKLKTTITT